MRMGMDLGQYQSQKQVQILAPRMIQSMEILQLPIMSLMDRIQLEMEKNPVLELKDPAADDGPTPETDFKGTESLEPDKPADPDVDPLVIDEKSSELDFERLEALSRDYGDFINEEHRPSRGGLDDEMDKKHDAMQNMASRRVSLQDYLLEQLDFLEVTPEQARLMRHVIGFVDRTGYLGLRSIKKKPRKKDADEPQPHEEDGKKKRDKDRDEDYEDVFVPVTLAEIANTYDRPVTEADVEEALLMVQKLEPAGVAARTLSECLLLQVTPDTEMADAVRTLLADHLENIQHNRLPLIQRETGLDLDEIRAALEVIRTLNPKPGLAFSDNENRYITPDVAVEQKDDGTWDVRLLDDWVPDVFVSKRYLEMSRDRGADPKTREYLKRKIQDALWLRESIEQRRATLEKVTRAIIEHQRDFLERGPEHIQPLKMQQIADQVKVHVTTVSRAVDDKYVQTPRGVFPLKRFFGGAAHNKQTGEDIAWERIKQRLLELINGEDKCNPLSDEELVDQMVAAGYPIKRRTVTKYRKMLNIPSSRQRKDWALVTAANGHHGHNGHHESDGLAVVPAPAAEISFDHEDEPEEIGTPVLG